MNFIESLQYQNAKFKLSLNDKEYSPLRLGDFFTLEELRDKFLSAVRKKDKKLFKKYLLETLELQTKEKVNPPDLITALRSLVEIYKNNKIDAEAVMLVPPPKNPNPKLNATQQEQDRWDYKTRYVAQWIDAFARAYHWSLEQIINLEVNVATYLFQEIRVNEQFEKEWQYSLSELAYQDKDGSGTRRFVPLKRPYWMNEHIDGVIKKVKIRKDMLPSGHIIDLSGMGVMSNNAEETN
jgi:hypothetical protein